MHSNPGGMMESKDPVRFINNRRFFGVRSALGIAERMRFWGGFVYKLQSIQVKKVDAVNWSVTYSWEKK
jgi:hypothetical protein